MGIFRWLAVLVLVSSALAACGDTPPRDPKTPNNINDPEENVDAGTHYLADLIKRYDGDIPKALAAYNAGPEAVEKYNGVPPFKETQQYVKAIMARIEPKEKE